MLMCNPQMVDYVSVILIDQCNPHYLVVFPDGDVVSIFKDQREKLVTTRCIFIGQVGS